MEKKRIEEGIIGESIAGENVKCFISIVDKETYFGYREIWSGKIIIANRTRNFGAAVQRVIDHALIHKGWPQTR